MNKIDEIAQKLFEKTMNQPDPTDYLKKNFEKLMKEVYEDGEHTFLSFAGFKERFKDARHKAAGLIYSASKK